MKKIIALLLILLSLSGCVGVIKDTAENSVAPINDDASDLKYRIITIEGMPCMVVVTHTYLNDGVTSIDCDWTKWDGNK